MKMKDLYLNRNDLYSENDRLFELYISTDGKISTLIADCILQNISELKKIEKYIFHNE